MAMNGRSHHSPTAAHDRRRPGCEPRRVNLFMRREHNTGASLPDGTCIQHDRRSCLCQSARERAGRFLSPDDSVRSETTQQQNTHIRDLREICYPWHPWYGRTVAVRTELVRHGQAIAHCSLQDVQTDRGLEVPLWMFDIAVCSSTRMTKLGFAS